MSIIYKLKKILYKTPSIRMQIRKLYLLIKYLQSKKNNTISLYNGVVMLNNKNNANGSTFFGYYDKSPWSPNGKYFLYHELLHNKDCRIIVLDIKNNSKKYYLTDTWNYQQGAMLQWLPRKNNTIVFNCSVKKILGCKIVDITTDSEKFYSLPIQCISPNGDEALSINYLLLYKLRKEYGYKGQYHNFQTSQNIDNEGIWKLTFKNGNGELLISISQLIEICYNKTMDTNKHKVNHLMYSPDGKKFIFMHRWFKDDEKYSRLYVSNSDGSNKKILLDDGLVSHYSWLNENSIIVYGSYKSKKPHYYKIDVNTQVVEGIGISVLDKYGDGHPTVSPDKKFIITDSYPDNSRTQRLLMWDIEKEKVQTIGEFYSPLKYENYHRCDLHPRWSTDGRYISIDSTYNGRRTVHMVDVSAIAK